MLAIIFNWLQSEFTKIPLMLINLPLKFIAAHAYTCTLGTTPFFVKV